VLVDSEVLVGLLKRQILVVRQMEHRDEARRDRALDSARDPRLSGVGLVAVLGHLAELEDLRLLVVLVVLHEDRALDLHDLLLGHVALHQLPHHVLQDLDLDLIMRLLPPAIIKIRKQIRVIARRVPELVEVRVVSTVVQIVVEISAVTTLKALENGRLQRSAKDMDQAIE
jgi:hypothetical protein